MLYCIDVYIGYANEIGATECGKIVSRLNKVLFDYQIGKINQDNSYTFKRNCLFLGDKANLSIISSIFSRRIIITVPETKQVKFDHFY